MKLSTAIEMLEAKLITEVDRNGEETYITLDNGHTIGPLLEDALPDMSEGNFYWCDALRFSGACEVVAEDELEDYLA